MKLSFHTHKLMHVDKPTAVAKTVSYLEKSDYNIIDRAPSHISFINNIERKKLGSYATYYTRINEGKVEFNEMNEHLDIHLTYRISIDFEIVFLLIIILCSFYLEGEIGLLSIPYILNFIIKVQYIRSHFLNNVVNSD